MSLVCTMVIDFPAAQPLAAKNTMAQTAMTVLRFSIFLFPSGFDKLTMTGFYLSIIPP